MFPFHNEGTEAERRSELPQGQAAVALGVDLRLICFQSLGSSFVLEKAACCQNTRRCSYYSLSQARFPPLACRQPWDPGSENSGLGIKPWPYLVSVGAGPRVLASKKKKNKQNLGGCK